MNPATISTTHYLSLSLLLLLIGLGGMLLRRNLIIILMSLELILNAVNINLVAFSQHWQHATGQVFGVFVITVAVAEASVGLALLIALYRNRGAINADEIRLLKW
jgi:NADH-quinone oxidoreductase subunit K